MSLDYSYLIKPDRAASAIMKPLAFSIPPEMYSYLQQQKDERRVSLSVLIREAVVLKMEQEGFVMEGRDHEQA